MARSPEKLRAKDIHVLKKPRLRIALFGAGGFGASHLEAIEQLEAEDLMELVAVADPFVEQLAEVKTRLEQRGVRWFADFNDLLSSVSDRLDAVAIAAPIPWHLPMLSAALDRGLAVYLEKPPIPLLQDFSKITSRPESQRVAVGFHLIADPALWRLKRAMREGAFGRIVRISASACWPRFTSYYKRAGWAGRMWWRDMPVFDGPATNALAHVVHHLMFLGGETEEAFAVPEEMQGEVYRAREMESYDLCGMAGSWASGIRFHLALSHAARLRDNWEIVVHGEKGEARLFDSGKSFTSPVELAEPLVPSPVELVREACWRNFHSFATGAIAKPFTALSDCRAYVASTNAMLLSSGGIHELPAEVCQTFEVDENAGIAVDGVNELVQSVHEGKLFSELSLPWAVSGGAVNARALRSIPFVDLAARR